MGRLKFNTDGIVEKVQGIGLEIPGLLSDIEAKGVAIHPSIKRFAPIVGMLLSIAGRFVTVEGEQSGFGRGLPMTGPLGRGRQHLLRKRSYFRDEQILTAFGLVCDALRQKGQASFAGNVTDTVNFTLGVLYPDKAEHTPAQEVDAILRVIEGDAIPSEICDKFGDLLYWVLTVGPSVQAPT